jgi:crossover junction endodeoxyribonuclease RuvC
VTVLGVDPGSHRTGWGVVALDKGRLRMVAAGVLRAQGGLPGRLVELRRGLAELLLLHRPQAIAVEEPFAQRFARSALVLAQARGVALLAAAEAGLDPHAYAPAMVKRVLCGSGKAEKMQMRRAVAGLLRLADLPPADAADALAVALCHVLAGGMRGLVGKGR